MKKIALTISILLVLIVAVLAWLIFGPGTEFKENKYTLYIHTGTDYHSLLDSLQTNNVLASPSVFNLLANRTDFPTHVKPGKYEIKKNTSLFNILRMLRNGKQTPVNLVIIKLRTKEDLAAMIGRHFECDSTSFIQFINNNDSLSSYGLDSNNAMTAIMPNTYTYFWNNTAGKIFKKLFAAHRDFWTPERRQLAASHGLNPATAYILASIVDEETTKKTDKPNIASVYLNRLSTGMRLAADPTIKFAMRNFELKRIYEKYLQTPSPYNTYLHEGLPPGPICTPSEETIDAVLHAPKTNYLYFVAKPDLSGYSVFADSYSEHLVNAKKYQHFLDSLMAGKNTN